MCNIANTRAPHCWFTRMPVCSQDDSAPSFACKPELVSSEALTPCAGPSKRVFSGACKACVFPIGRAAMPTLAFPPLSVSQLDLKFESSKRVKRLSRGPQRHKVTQTYKDHAVYSDFFSSRRKCKAEGYQAGRAQHVGIRIRTQHVAGSCWLSAKTHGNEQAVQGAKKKRKRRPEA